MIQGLVIFIAGVHGLIETGTIFPALHGLYAMPIGLFLVPVVYAALTFGFAGALATALWATVLSIPNVVFWHEGLEKLEEVFQIVVVNVVAFLVGQQVNREKGARQEAEAAATALKASRMKYRSLFESSPVAILVLDGTGVILEANPAASLLFGKDKPTLEGMSIADLLGATGEHKLLGSSQNGNWQVETLAVKLKDGPEVYLERTLTEVSDGQGDLITQVLFRDVTKEHDRQAGLRAYAAHVIRAQEEERQRIARELHDGTIQSLLLLCRRLDSLQASSDSLPSALSNTLRETREIAEGVIGELRDFTKALRPPTLDDLGMVTSIRRLLADLGERTGIEGKLKLAGEECRLPLDTEVGMFRIAQEALWNIERHAKATRVAVTITFAEDEAKLEVVDNGIGFSPPADSRGFMGSRQLGLLSMRERAELLGGKLEIQSSPGKGTRVAVSVPIGEGTTDISPAVGDSRSG